MSQHEEFITFLLGFESSIGMSLLAFFLMSLYSIQFFILPKGHDIIIARSVRRNRLIMRSFNWFIFGAVFLFFGDVIHLKEIDTWRATARVALLFLMLPEIAYQLTVLYPIFKELVWTKR